MDRALLTDCIQQVFDGKVVWGKDLMQLTLTAPTVAKIEGY